MRPLVPVLALFLSVPLFAEDAGDGKELDVASPNGAWSAHVRPAPGIASPVKNAGALSIFKAKEGKPDGAAVWTTGFDGARRMVGALSDDGQHFAALDPAYRPFEPMVTLWSSAGRAARAPLGCEFAFPSAGVRTAAMDAWLDTDHTGFDDGGLTLLVTDIGGHKRWLDAASGRICGYAGGPLRGALQADRRVAAIGESVTFSFGLLNVGTKNATTWHAAIWPNHRVVLEDERDHEAPLAGFGQTARRIFASGGRDKNAQWTVKPGEWDDQLRSDTVERHFAVQKPGRYTLKVEYVDDCDGVPVKVVSNPVQIVYFKDALPSPMEIGDRLSDAVAARDRSLVAPLVKAGMLTDAEWAALAESDGMVPWRAVGARTFAPDDGPAVMSRDEAKAFRIELEKCEGGWRIAGFTPAK